MRGHPFVFLLPLFDFFILEIFGLCITCYVFNAPLNMLSLVVSTSCFRAAQLTAGATVFFPQLSLALVLVLLSILVLVRLLQYDYGYVYHIMSVRPSLAM
jgi:hypothetical protein